MGEYMITIESGYYTHVLIGTIVQNYALDPPGNELRLIARVKVRPHLQTNDVIGNKSAELVIDRAQSSTC